LLAQCDATLDLAQEESEWLEAKPVGGETMKDEYDFSNAEQGKFYVPVEDIQIPVYLDKDVMQFLNKQCDFNAEKIKFIN
jgi:hypothetical protein